MTPRGDVLPSMSRSGRIRDVGGVRRSAAFSEEVLSNMSRLDPPDELKRMVGGVEGFEAVGDSIMDVLVGAGLRPDDDVLDLGCGVGRVAIPLTGYLAPSSRYEGLDIVPQMITWCSSHITPRFANFRFRLSPVWNGAYNPAGAVRAEHYSFPYGNEMFDFVFATSVFTHLRPDDAASHLSEIFRVLRPHGTCVTTWFLYPESQDPLDRAPIGFPNRHGKFSVHNETVPEEAIAFSEVYCRRMLWASGLTIREPIFYGGWGSVHGGSQDYIVSKKAWPLPRPAPAPAPARK
jgi:SAM-dependent methyltransferase